MLVTITPRRRVGVGLSILAGVIAVACGEDVYDPSFGTAARPGVDRDASSPTPDGSANGSAEAGPSVLDASVLVDGTADAAVTGDAAPVDPCIGRTVCENFENVAVGQVPAAPWKVRASKGQVKVDQTRAHSGQRSLKVSIDATASGDTYRQAMLAVDGAPLLPLKDNTVYGRFFLWVDRVPDKSVHYTFASGSGPVGNLYAVYNYGGMGGLMANYYKGSDPGTDCWQTKDESFATGAWKCVAFKLDGKSNEMRFWLDDVEIPELHVLGNTKTDQTCTVSGVDGRWLAPTFDNIRVGWESYQHDVAGAHDAWIDDVIFDDLPISCAP